MAEVETVYFSRSREDRDGRQLPLGYEALLKMEL